jgi:hypothetical protein
VYLRQRRPGARGVGTLFALHPLPAAGKLCGNKYVSRSNSFIFSNLAGSMAPKPSVSYVSWNFTAQNLCLKTLCRFAFYSSSFFGLIKKTQIIFQNVAVNGCHTAAKYLAYIYPAFPLRSQHADYFPRLHSIVSIPHTLTKRAVIDVSKS